MMLLEASFVWVMSMSQSWMAPKCSVASTASPYCIKVFALLHLKQHETYVVEGSWKSDIEENLVQKLPAHTCKVDWIGGSLGSHPSGFANASFWLGKPSALGPINAGSQRDQGIQLSLNLNSSIYFPMAARWWESLHEPGLVWFDCCFWCFFEVNFCKNKHGQRVTCKWCPPCQMSVCSWPQECQFCLGAKLRA